MHTLFVILMVAMVVYSAVFELPWRGNKRPVPLVRRAGAVVSLALCGVVWYLAFRGDSSMSTFRHLPYLALLIAGTVLTLIATRNAFTSKPS